MKKDKFDLFRRKAEKLMNQVSPPQQAVAKEFTELAHELQVHQIELDLQNEELRETQTRLQETTKNYFELYEFAPVGYMNMNDRGIISSVNLQLVKKLDIPRSKLIGKAFGGFVNWVSQDKFFTHLRAVLADTENHSCELAITRRDQTGLFVKMESGYAGKNSAGEKILRSVIMDITELTETRKIIDGLNRDLERKVTERTATSERRLDQLKKLNVELIRAEQRERQKLAELLHDNLQQLLVGCQLNVSFVRKGRHEKKTADVLETTSKALKDALELSRSLSYELFPPILSMGGLPAAFDWLKDQKKALYDFTVHLKISPNFPRLPMDIEAFLFHCAKELLLNSLKHAKTKHADLTVNYLDGILTLCVSDKGQGCELSGLKGDPKTKKGFGLFNIQNRIEIMDGSFQVDATDKGFAVTLSLPVTSLLEESQAAAEKAETSIVKTPPLKKSKAPIRVMLVEDHQVLREAMVRLLEIPGEITIVAEAGDGFQAVEMARSCKPDVILMDIKLPGMDGIEATAQIIKENHSIRIIALSLYESERLVNRMLEAGASRYLNKNVRVEELIEAIRTVAAMG